MEKAPLSGGTHRRLHIAPKSRSADVFHAGKNTEIPRNVQPANGAALEWNFVIDMVWGSSSTRQVSGSVVQRLDRLSVLIGQPRGRRFEFSSAVFSSRCRLHMRVFGAVDLIS